MKPSLEKTWKENWFQFPFLYLQCIVFDCGNIEIVMYNSSIFKNSIKNVNFILKLRVHIQVKKGSLID